MKKHYNGTAFHSGSCWPWLAVAGRGGPWLAVAGRGRPWLAVARRIVPLKLEQSRDGIEAGYMSAQQKSTPRRRPKAGAKRLSYQAGRKGCETKIVPY